MRRVWTFFSLILFSVILQVGFDQNARAVTSKASSTNASSNKAPSEPQSSQPTKAGKTLSYYFRVPSEVTTPHLLEPCPVISMPEPKLMRTCQKFVSGSEIEALRCESLDGRFFYLVYNSKKDCQIDREAMLANED